MDIRVKPESSGLATKTFSSSLALPKVLRSMPLPIGHRSLEVRELGRSNSVVVMNRSNPLSSRKTVSVDELLSQMLIHFQRGGLAQRQLEAIFGNLKDGAHFEVTSGPMGTPSSSHGR